MAVLTIATDRPSARAVLVVAVALTISAPAVEGADVPVPGGRDVAAGMLGVRPTPDAARFVPEVIRVLYALPPDRNEAALRNIARFQAAAPDLDHARDWVPMPLSAAFWSRAVLDRDTAPDALLPAILQNRAAALLCYGLLGLDDETLAYLEAHPQIPTRIYRRGAGIFAAFAGSLHVHDGRIAPPGGAGAAPLWEAAIGRPLGDPMAFIEAWLETDAGRLAYLYDIVDQLEPPQRAFATGAWMQDPTERADRFAALVAATDQAVAEWDIDRLPFARPQYDVAALLWRVRARPDGAPAPPALQSLWGPAFESDTLPDDPTPLATGADIDAAWLVRAAFQYDGRQRGWRFGQLTFGQRALAAAGPADPADALVALRGYLRFPQLMLELERMGIRSPAVFAAAARRAAQFDRLDGSRAFAALGQFQGALVLVSRMVRVRTLDAATARTLVENLIDRPLTRDGWYDGAVAEWIADVLAPRLDPAADIEHALINALGGASAPDGATHVVTWEGQTYRLDLGAAERRRLALVREKQGVEPIDVSLTIAVIRRRLSGRAATLDSDPRIDRRSPTPGGGAAAQRVARDHARSRQPARCGRRRRPER